jgi:hypothetical protein
MKTEKGILRALQYQIPSTGCCLVVFGKTLAWVIINREMLGKMKLQKGENIRKRTQRHVTQIIEGNSTDTKVTCNSLNRKIILDINANLTIQADCVRRTDGFFCLCIMVLKEHMLFMVTILTFYDTKCKSWLWIISQLLNI